MPPTRIAARLMTSDFAARFPDAHIGAAGTIFAGIRKEGRDQAERCRRAPFRRLLLMISLLAIPFRPAVLRQKARGAFRFHSILSSPILATPPSPSPRSRGRRRSFSMPAGQRITDEKMAKTGISSPPAANARKHGQHRHHHRGGCCDGLRKIPGRQDISFSQPRLLAKMQRPLTNFAIAAASIATASPPPSSRA